MKPLCLSIGGFDPTGGAGVSLDRSVFRELLVDSCELISVLTEQTTDLVSRKLEVDREYFASSLNFILKYYKFNAVKVGLMGASLVHALVNSPPFLAIPIKVIDPILYSTSGFQFIKKEDLAPLLRISTLLTPNYVEFLSILDLEIKKDYSAEYLSEKFSSMYPHVTVLVKGFKREAEDFLIENGSGSFIYTEPSKTSSNLVHGTGCLLSSAITANLAKGEDVRESVVNAKLYLTSKLDQASLLQNDRRRRFLF